MEEKYPTSQTPYVPYVTNLTPANEPVKDDAWIRQLAMCCSPDITRELFRQCRKMDQSEDYETHRRGAVLLKALDETVSRRYKQDAMEMFMQEASVAAYEPVKPFD